MTETVEKKWYVIRGISGQENKIKDYIESEVKRLNIFEFVEEVIVPTQKVVQIRNGKKVSKEKVYFPMKTISNVEQFKDAVITLQNNISDNLFIINSEEIYFTNIIIKIFKDKTDLELKSFNENVLYGHETKFENLLLKASNFPMMGDIQFFLIRDSNNLIKDIEKYSKNLSSIPKSSVIVFFISDPNFSKKKHIIDFFKTNGKIINFKKIYDNQLSPWVKYISNQYGFELDYKTTQLVTELTGNNLSKINNEFEKLCFHHGDSKEIDEKTILNHFGINNEYNLFELQNQYGKRNLNKVLKISEYFSKNSSKYPIQIVLSNLYNYYTKIFQIHSLNKSNNAEISQKIGVNAFFLNDFKNASMNINMKETVKVLDIIKGYDLKSKGISTITENNRILTQLALEILG